VEMPDKWRWTVVNEPVDGFDLTELGREFQSVTVLDACPSRTLIREILI